MARNERRYSTGLTFLDQRLDGGIPAGSLLAIAAEPQSQSELLLRQLVQTHRTLFVSMTRPAAEVETWAERGARTLPELSVIESEPSDLLADITPVEAAHSPESLVLIDRTNGLEAAARGEYLSVLNDLKQLLERTDSVGVLHCSETTPPPDRRGLTLDRADQVWELELLYLSREIKSRLLVTKSRKSRALTEPIDLSLTDRVQVDTSRRIG